MLGDKLIYILAQAPYDVVSSNGSQTGSWAHTLIYHSVVFHILPGVVVDSTLTGRVLSKVRTESYFFLFPIRAVGTQ